MSAPERWMSYLLEERAEVDYQNGLEEREREAKTEGRTEAMRRAALAMLACNMDPPRISDLTELSLEEIVALSRRE